MVWLSGWGYRKSHEIDGTVVGVQTDYQKKITVHYGSGDDSDEHVYLNNKCRTDFGDIRFTKDDGTTELDYWLEEKVDSDYAVFWVEIDTIPESPDSVTIYVYYGKSDATTTSNGANTFPYFDDFSIDTSGNYENKVGSCNLVVSDGKMTISGLTNNSQNITAHKVFAQKDVALDVKVFAVTTNELAGYETSPSVIRITASGRYVNETDVDAIPDNVKIAQYYTPVSYLTGDLAGNVVGHVVTLAGFNTTLRYLLDYISKGSGTGVAGGNVTGQVGFGVYRSVGGVTAILVIDWAHARNYCEPEPTHGDWGSVESLYKLTGVTRDADGNILSGCTVWLFETETKDFKGETVSDDEGVYEFTVESDTIEHFIRAYKDGTPNIFGTSERDLKGVEE